LRGSIADKTQEHITISSLDDKDLKGILASLKKLTDWNWIAASTLSPRKDDFWS